MTRCVTPLWYGRIGYRRALYEQSRLVAKVKACVQDSEAENGKNLPQNFCMLLEHFPVYTVGIRDTTATAEDQLRLTALGAEFYRTDRGGLITFHGPGQLIVYPILNLANWGKVGAVKWYVNTLEKTLVQLCRAFALEAGTTEHNGVWLGDNKIAAIGLHVKRYVTSHGISLNCTTDLSWFEHITACGIEGKGSTSLSRELNRTVSVAEVVPMFLSAFESCFACSVQSVVAVESTSL